MLLLGKTFGVNIDMTGHGRIQGEKVLCKKGCIAQRNEKSEFFTVLILQTYFVNLFVAL